MNFRAVDSCTWRRVSPRSRPSCERAGAGLSDRPVRWVVGFPPGGAPDIVALIIGPWLSDRFGQPIIVENRPGAGHRDR
jgi:tripartite-type tricarboxylate transporter receptor subunit TctC